MLGAYLRAEQAAGRVNADADPDAIALLVIDCRLRPRGPAADAPHSEEPLPSSDALLDEISRLLR